MLQQGLSGKGGVTLPADVNGQALAILGRGGHRSGRFYGVTTVRENSTKALSANTLYLVPLLIPQRQAYNAIGVYPTVAVGVNARMGIYSDTGGYSGSLLLDAGAMALTASAQNNVSFTRTIEAGAYFAAIVTDAACTLTAPGASLHAYLHGLINLNSTAPLLSVSHTYGALPVSFSSPTITESSTSILIGVKAA